MTLRRLRVNEGLVAIATFVAVPSVAWAQDAAELDPRTLEQGESTVDESLLPDFSAEELESPALDPRPGLPEIDRRDAELEPIALPAGESKSGVTPQALSVPSDGGSVEGMGESFSPLLSSGTATFSVPVALPPGRRGAQPSLAFSYSSSSGNGLLGIGWSLSVPFIQRQTDKGLPRYDGTDRFVYNGGQELVEVAPAADADGNLDNGIHAEVLPGFVRGFRYFRARVEGAYLRFFLAPDESYWVVQDKDGGFFYLGDSEESRVEKEGWGVFSWSLTLVIDARGNEVRYLYRSRDETGQVYLAEIVWNGPVELADGDVVPRLGAPSDEFQHSVRFTYEGRDDAIESYVSRFRVATELRLAGVAVESYLSREDPRRTPDRRYVLAYDPDSYLSLLGSIQVVGREGTALPPMTFGYSAVDPHAGPGGELADDLPGWGGFDGRVYELGDSPDHSLDEARTDLFDIDADAFPDALVTDPARYEDGHGVFFLDFVDGVGDYTSAQIIDVPRSIGGDLTLSGTNVRPMDLDADGRVELLHMPHVREWSAFTADGDREAGFAWVEHGPYDPAHEDIDLTRDAAEIRLVDVDNDNRVDVIRTSGTRYEYYRNRGDGTFEDPVTSCVLHRGMPLSFSNGDLDLADMNGDGLQDLVHLRRGDVGYFPARGYGLWGGEDDLPSDCTEGEFGPDREVVMDPSPFWSLLDDDRVQLGDVNGDGLSDVVQTRFDGVDIWVNEGGRGFSGRYIIERSPFDPGFTQRVRLTDVNASGSRDILWGDAERYRFLDLTGGIRPRLLTRVDNGLGKTTELAYEPHTAQQSRATDRGEPWTTFAPFPVQVVSTMTVRDNMGGEYVTEYEYRDAVYDGLEAEFRGFREAIVRAVGDENSPTSEQRTVFWPGERPEGSDPHDNPYEALKGAVGLTETCDLEGTCLETSHTSWTIRRLYTGANGDPRSVWQAVATQTDTLRYDTAPFERGGDELVLAAIRGDAPEVDDEVTARGGSYAHLRSETEVDAAGNELRSVAQGVVGDASDDVVTHTTHTNLSDWLWRPVESYVEPDLRRTRSEYDEQGDLVDRFARLAEEDREIHEVHNTYDGAGQLREVEEGGEGAAALRRRRMTYDEDFSAYPVEEEVFTSAETALVTMAVWDAGFGVVTELHDFNEQTTTIEYDDLSRVVSIVRPGCTEAAVRYDYLLAGDTGRAFSEVVTRSNELCGDGEPEDAASSLESHAFVDGLGRARMTLSEADPARGDGGAWVRSGLVSFDAKGAASRAYLADFRDSADFSLAAPLNGYASTRYDAFGRLTRSVAPDRLAATETLYHALSQDVFDPNDLDPTSGHYGTPATSVSDGQGRLVSTIERNRVDGLLREYVASYSYDPLGNLLAIDRTDGTRNVRRSLGYDSLGRRVANDDPDSGSWSYEYSDLGELVRTTDAREVQVSYAYDLAGRLVAEDYDDDGVVDVAYTFDEPRSFGLGRLTTIHDLSGTTEVFHDERGRELRMARTLEHDGVRREESRSYDELDRQTSLTYPDGSVASFEYTARGLLYSAAVDGFSAVGRIEYDASGQKLLEELGDAEATRNEYVYDRRQRLTRLTSVTGAGRYFQDNQYQYDRASNLTALRDLRTPQETDGWSPSPADQDYQYDALYRLTRNRTTYAEDEPDRPREQTWRYDFSGNMTEWRDDQSRFFERSLGTITNGLDADPTGTTRPHALVSARLDDSNHAETTYNASGDMETLTVTAGGIETAHGYEWDQVHRLVRATSMQALGDPGGEIDVDPPSLQASTFTYDFADQRRVKDSPDDTVLYVSDTFELREGVATKWLEVGGRRLLRIDAAEGGEGGDGDRVSFYLANHLGTTSVVLDDSGQPRSASTYLPYGALESEVTSPADPLFDPAYRFTGKERDAATNLDYFGARYYAPSLGRWLSPDPAAVHGLKPQWSGPWSYAEGSPARLIDPDGRDAALPAAAAAGAVAAIFSEVAEIRHQMIDEGQAFFQLDERRIAARGAEAFIAVTGTVYAMARGGQRGLVIGAAVSNAAGASAGRALRGERTSLSQVVREGAKGATVAMGASVLGRLVAPVAERLAERLRTAMAVPATPGPAAGGGGRNLHTEAVAARDSLAGELATQRHPPATVVGAYSPSSGRVTAGASRGGGLGCAEGVCSEALGHPPDIRFTPAVRPRTGQPVDVCPNCEATYGRGAFPDPATRFRTDSGGQ
ncbi:MAG: VCBS repeat-containing protein [Deltaproteobacteria bacterium]|nr:VCBS repeat-containing protein [Deltaproteobacteria bacterium]